LTWRLRGIMKSGFRRPRRTPAEKAGQPKTLMLGANIAGFLKVADAMIAQGAV